MRMNTAPAIFCILVLTLALLGASTACAAKPEKDCITIQDGVLTYSKGHYLEDQPLMVGYDCYGYNYQAHMFNGYYANVYLGRDGFPPYEGDDDTYLAANPSAASKWYWPYRQVKLVMKWNDAWLSNKDCDGDGLLDRHYRHDVYIGSGAWETNHQWETYVGDDGKEHRWEYFVKIVALDEPYAPSDGETDYVLVYDSEGNLLGKLIWGSFVRVLQVYNDPYAGDHGIEFLAPPAGFGVSH
jgi:hypothetical protein